jgi:hypothetical protein
VVCALGELFARAETPGLHSREEATVHTTVDERGAANRTTDRRADLATAACYLVVVFSGVVLMVVLTVAAFVI